MGYPSKAAASKVADRVRGLRGAAATCITCMSADAAGPKFLKVESIT